MNSLSGSSAVAIAELVIKGLKEGNHYSLEFFPKLVSTIASQKTIQSINQEGKCLLLYKFDGLVVCRCHNMGTNKLSLLHTKV